MRSFANLRIYDEIFLHVYAPVMVSYVRWVLEESSRAGKERLYFLARDGWLMEFAAKELSVELREKGIQMPEIRYLHVSRYALRRAEYLIQGQKSIDLICLGGIDVTFRKIMARAVLTDEETRHIARLTEYESKLDETLNPAQIQKLKELLRRTDLFMAYVYKHAEECFDETLGYLRQEGLMDQIPSAIVDSGWIGTIQTSLMNLIRAGRAGTKSETDSDADIEGYYFGLYENEKFGYHAWYINNRQKIAQNLIRKKDFSICLFETVFSSPEGMTTGYCRKEGKYLPVMEKAGNSNKEYMFRNKELLAEYLKHYCNYCKTNEAGDRTADYENKKSNAEEKMVRQILKFAMGNPTDAEAKNLGGLLFCDDILEHTLQPVAARWNTQELKKQRFFPKILTKLNLLHGTIHESGWPEGSLVNAGRRNQIRQEHLYRVLMYLRKNRKNSKVYVS